MGAPPAPPSDAVSQLVHHGVSQIGHGLLGGAQAFWNQRPSWLGGPSTEEADRQLMATMGKTYQPTDPTAQRLARIYDNPTAALQQQGLWPSGTGTISYRGQQINPENKVAMGAMLSGEAPPPEPHPSTEAAMGFAAQAAPVLSAAIPRLASSIYSNTLRGPGAPPLRPPTPPPALPPSLRQYPVARLPVPAAPGEAPELSNAKSLGLYIDPARAGGPVGTTLQGIAGSAKTERAVSLANVNTVNQRGAEDLNLRVLTPQAVQVAAAKTNAVFATVGGTGYHPFGPEFVKDIETGLPENVSPNLTGLREKFLNTPGMDAQEIMREMSDQRRIGYGQISGESATEREEGRGRVKLAEALLQQVDRNLVSTPGTPPDLIDQFRAARVQRAKLFSVENAMVGPFLSAQLLNRQWNNGAPLTGNLLKIAQAYENYDRSLQIPPKIRDLGMSYGDVLLGLLAERGAEHGAGVMGALGHAITNPLLLAPFMARPMLRQQLATGLYQRFGVQQNEPASLSGLASKYLTPPPAAPQTSPPTPQGAVPPAPLSLTPSPGRVSQPLQAQMPVQQAPAPPPGGEPLQLTPPPGEAGRQPQQGNLDLPQPGPTPRPPRPPAPIPDLGKLLAPDSGEVGEDTHAYNAGPAALPFETRPDTTPQQVALGRAAMRDLLTFRDRGGQAAVLAHGLTKDFAEKGNVSLLGQTITSPHDLATAAQVLRDPRFETMRVFFMKNGKIDDHIAATSRLPGAAGFTQSFFKAIADRAAQSDGYWLMHNHPSGNPIPSDADVLVTSKIAEENPGFLGHVVIDHNAYGVISAGHPGNPYSPNLNVDVIQHHFGGYDPAANPEVPHDLLNTKIDRTSQLADIARQLQTKEGLTTLIATDSQNRIRAIADFPTSALTGSKAWAQARIRKMQLQSGAGNNVLAVAPQSAMEALSKLPIRDAVTPDGSHSGLGYRSMPRVRMQTYPQVQPEAQPPQGSLFDLSQKYEVNEPYAGDWQQQLAPAGMGATLRARASAGLREQRATQIEQLKTQAFQNVDPAKSLGPPIDTKSPGISPTMQLTGAFDKALQQHLALPPAERALQAKAASDSIHQLVKGPLITQNGKLMKGDTGIQTWGLSLSPDYIDGRMMMCPNSGACRALCLGFTSGNYHKGGGGIDLSKFSGPRLASLQRTFAMLHDPQAFAVQLNSEINTAQQNAAREGEQLGVRLNVLSDINPKVFKSLIAAHPDVQFYDYTKMPYEPVGPNHHYTYSSTGVSQPAGWNGNDRPVINPNQNWRAMRQRLDSGRNVAMAFTDKEHLPQWVQDAETGKRYMVVNGDAHDFRPLDQQPQGQPGVITGLKNKKAAGQVRSAHADTDGFFVYYDPHVQLTDRGTIQRGAPPEGKKRGVSTATNPGVYIAPQGTDMKPFTDNDLSEMASWKRTQ